MAAAAVIMTGNGKTEGRKPPGAAKRLILRQDAITGKVMATSGGGGGVGGRFLRPQRGAGVRRKVAAHSRLEEESVSPFASARSRRQPVLPFQQQ